MDSRNYEIDEEVLSPEKFPLDEFAQYFWQGDQAIEGGLYENDAIDNLSAPATIVFAVDDYDNGYCKDPVELQKWANLLAENPDSDDIVTLHSLWIGLFLNVGNHTLTTERANNIFESFKWGLIMESIEAEEEKPKKEPM